MATAASNAPTSALTVCIDQIDREEETKTKAKIQSQPPGPKKRPESRLTRPAGVRKGRSTRHSQAGPSNSKARPVKPSRSQDEPSCRASAIAGPSKYMPLTPPRDHRSLSEQLDTQEGSPHSDELAGWPAALPIRPRSDEQSSQPEPARTPSPDDNVDAPNGISYDINGYTAIEQDVVWTLTALGFERDMLQNPAKYSHTAQNSRKLAWHWADLAMAKWKQAASLLKKARPSDSDFFTTDEDNSETGDGDDTDDTDYID
ncbi:hypothetical protein BJX70DRAFT_397622 [Aspergillus crustosus]